jgi:hypothetical protein
MGSQKTRMPIVMQIVEPRVTSLQVRPRTLVGIVLEAISYILGKNLSTFCPCFEILSDAEFKSSELINH